MRLPIWNWLGPFACVVHMDSMSLCLLRASITPASSVSPNCSPMAAINKSCHSLERTLLNVLRVRIQHPPSGNVSHAGTLLLRNRYRLVLLGILVGFCKCTYAIQNSSTVVYDPRFFMLFL